MESIKRLTPFPAGLMFFPMLTNVADPAAADWTNASEHRTPGIAIKQLLQREGDGSSLEFNVVRFAGEEFWSPRHRHNFDQIRIGLRGNTSYGPHATLTERCIGYYPEGTRYGPLSVQSPETVQAIMQFDGASRGGYVTYVHLDKASAELRELGEFKRGYFHPFDGSKPIDGYQASWERATGRSMVYPEPRFAEPVYLQIDAFRWLPTAVPGVERKDLAQFGERDTAISMTRLAPGAVFEIPTDRACVIVFALSGSVTATDGLTTSAVNEWGALMVEPGEAVRIEAGMTPAELVHIRLPYFE